MVRVATDSRLNILKVAMQLFLQKGYKNVSYQELVKRTGLSKGAIYHYFASKEALLEAVFNLFLEGGRAVANDDALEKVTDVASFKKFYADTKIGQLNEFKRFLETDETDFNWLLFFMEAINENEQLKSIVLEISQLEIKFLEKCFLGLQAHGGLANGKDPRLLAEALYYQLEGAGLLIVMVEKWSDAGLVRHYDKTITDFFKII